MGKWSSWKIKIGNGGDTYKPGGVPSTEEDVCSTLGIDMVWGLEKKFNHHLGY